MLFYPKMYKKSIKDIDYSKLKKNGIKCLIYDLDNTIALIDEELMNKEYETLLKKLGNDFKIIIISNNTNKNRVSRFAEQINGDYIYKAMKPLKRGLRKIVKKYKFKKSEMAIIGDQLVTDILSGNSFKVYSILVDPMAKKDLKITYLNRMIERRILKKYEKKNIMKKGEYYG